jgi:zinc protease
MARQTALCHRLLDQRCEPAGGEAFMKRLTASIFCVAAVLIAGASAASAMTIEKIVSPAGIEAWLVREKAVPLVTLNYAFHGGATQDEADKTGTANLAADLLDEGAGDLDSKAFHERMENHAIELTFQVGRDYFHGSLRSLNEHRDEAFDLLHLALTNPRFDADAIERVRGQELSMLQRDTTNPNDLASRRWWEVAFPGHPYGRQTKGTLESVPRITADDLRGYARHVLARNGLTISIVGDVDAKTAGALIDRAFAGLPAKNDLKPVANAMPSGLGRRIVINVDVPQAVVTFGGQGIARHDPDFMAAYVVNHILGGGGFSSRLYKEVREKRGLAYGVSDSLVWFQRAAVALGGTATRSDRTADALAVIEEEIKRMADEGPTPDELAAAKSFLKGSYALTLDTSAKIAAQLTQIQLDNLGIDYIQRRGALIDAVTIEDAKRVARKLYGGGMLVTVAGRPKGLTSTGTTD